MKTLKTTVLSLLGILMLAGCSKYDEVEFAGVVVNVQVCSLDMARPSAGYLVQLTTPDSAGLDLTFEGMQYDNAMLLFGPDRVLKVDDRIHGTFYFDKDASRQHCQFNFLNDLGIPQGVFLEVAVD